MIEGAVLTSLDTATVRRAEASLRESEARQAFLLKLSDALGPLANPAAIQGEACRLLGEQLGVDRAYYVEMNEAQGYARVEQDYARCASSSLVGQYPLSAYGWAVPICRTGQAVIVADTQNSHLVPEADRGAMASIDVISVAAIPLVKNGVLVGAFAITDRTAREWTEVELALTRETAERIWANVVRARAEGALRESEARYRTLFESIDEGFCVVEMIFDEAGKPADYRFLEANAVFERQTGLADAVGKTALQLVPELERWWIDTYGTVALTGESARFEHGSEPMGRWFDVYASRVGGEVSRKVAIVFNDITERKRTEAALRESEARLRLVLDSATDYAIITIDSVGAFTGWNAGARNIFGWEAAEILGRQASLIFTPEDRAAGADQAEMRNALEQGRASDERWHVRKDGSRFWGAGLLMPMREPAPEGFLKILRDRTEERQAQAALLESEERFRQFAENSADTLWIVNAETVQLEYLSPAYETMWGEPRDAVMGDLKNWAERVHPEDRERAMAGMPRLLAGEILVNEYRIVRPDGSVRWIHDTGFPIRDERGIVRRVGGIAQEVTAQKNAEQRQTMLVAELQHRTRNLLAIVRATARQTLDASPSFEAFGREFDGRLAALARVQGLISRAAGEAADLGGIVRAELAAHGARVDGTRVTVDGPAVALPARAVQMVALALHELATNALKHGALAAPEGRLEVRWRFASNGGAARSLIFEWRESNVAMPAGAPARRGYGRELIENALPYDLEAEIQLEFGAGGVRCRIELPLSLR